MRQVFSTTHARPLPPPASRAAACSSPPAQPSAHRLSSRPAAKPRHLDETAQKKRPRAPELRPRAAPRGGGARQPGSTAPSPRAVDTVTTLQTQRKESISQLEAIRRPSATGKPRTSQPRPPRPKAPPRRSPLQLEDSIEASLASIGDLSSPAYRQAVHRYVTEDAAALAALRSITRRRGRPRRLRLRRAGITGGRRMSRLTRRALMGRGLAGAGALALPTSLVAAATAQAQSAEGDAQTDALERLVDPRAGR